jgi:hypothetical protein
MKAGAAILEMSTITYFLQAILSHYPLNGKGQQAAAPKAKHDLVD